MANITPNLNYLLLSTMDVFSSTSLWQIFRKNRYKCAFCFSFKKIYTYIKKKEEEKKVLAFKIWYLLLFPKRLWRECLVAAQSPSSGVWSGKASPAPLGNRDPGLSNPRHMQWPERTLQNRRLAVSLPSSCSEAPIQLWLDLWRSAVGLDLLISSLPYRYYK